MRAPTSLDALPPYQISTEYLVAFYHFLLLSFHLRAFKMATAVALQLLELESISLNLSDTERLQTFLKCPFWQLLGAAQTEREGMCVWLLNTRSSDLGILQCSRIQINTLMRKILLTNFSISFSANLFSLSLKPSAGVCNFALLLEMELTEKTGVKLSVQELVSLG